MGAVTKQTRRVILALHRWTGLLLLVFLFIAAFSGAVLSFQRELDRLINHNLFVVEVGTKPLSYAEIIQNVESQSPGSVVSLLMLPKERSDAVVLFLKPKKDSRRVFDSHSATENGRVFDQIMVNPYNGKIIGQRSSTSFILSREQLIPLISRLHYSLFLGQTGIWIMGGSAFVWLITLFFGLTLSWPKQSRKWVSWFSLLRVRWKEGNFKINYDLHQFFSLLTFPVLAVVAFTALFLNLPEVVKPITNIVSPLTPPFAGKSRNSSETAGAGVSADHAVLTLKAAFPEALPSSLTLDFRKKVYAVRFFLPGDVSRYGNNTAYISMANGQVDYLRLAKNDSAGDRFLSWMRPLHGGRAFGTLGQLLVLCTALSLCLICITGLNVYVSKVTLRRR